tara:strand:- start:1354 stop:2355 length:1002 start_codon:yes stop_codon:yes gene_type:complete
VVLIIAEAGVNHNGCINTAKKLVEAAVEAKADIVKFQTFTPDDLTIKKAPLAKYQLANSPELLNQYKLLDDLKLNIDDHIKLKEYCDELGIEFLSTAFTTNSVDLLLKLKLKRWKIPSGEINNILLLKKIAKLNQPTILSTGMSNIGEIEAAIDVLYDNNLSSINLTILHCTTSYPTPMEEVNLNAINTIKKCFQVDVGYSDHTLGTEVSIAAVAKGASIIEKHITLDRNMNGPDHKASIEPNELKYMIKSIRNIEKALGDGIKKPTKSERVNIKVARKSIVASCNIKKGELFSTNNLSLKRPGDGLSPTHFDLLIGKKASKEYMKDEKIKLL